MPEEILHRAELADLVFPWKSILFVFSCRLVLPSDNYNCAEGQLLLSKRTTLALQKDSFWKAKGLLLKIRRNLSEKWKGKSEKSDGVALFGNSGGNDVSSGVVSGLAKQIVGGYGVPAVAWAVRQYILIVSFFYTTACSGGCVKSQQNGLKAPKAHSPRQRLGCTDWK